LISYDQGSYGAAQGMDLENRMKIIRGLAGMLAATLFSWPLSAAAEIHIAVAGPMKGQFEDLGQQIRAGAEQAVVDINMAGGVLGEPLVLDIVDDGCDETQAKAVANQLIGREVSMVVGHVCFSASIPASEIYSEAGIVQISPATTLPKYTDERPGPGIYRLAPRDDEQARVLGRYLADAFAGQDIALLHDKTAYGKGLTDAVRVVLNQNGVTETLYEGFDAGLNDYRILVSRLALEGADVVFIGGYHPEAGLIKLEMQRLGVEAVLVGGDTLMTQAFWDVTGEAGEGTTFSYPLDPRSLQTVAEVIESLESREEIAERYALAAYAAVEAWAEAVEAAGAPDFAAVTKVMDEQAFPTILGDISFDDKGDSSVAQFVIYEWKSGKPIQR
jgi:branched-chain amino acid transport system substrate-binding protein